MFFYNAISMNIIFCTRGDVNPIKGGIERVTFGLTEYFLSKGHKVAYVILVKTEKEIEYKVPVFYLKTNNPYDDSNVIEYNRILDEFKADIVINQYGMSSPEVCLFSNVMKKNIKLFNVLHSTPFAIYNNFWTYTLGFKGLKKVIRIILYPLLKYRYFRERLRHFKLIDVKGVTIVTLCNQYKNELLPFIKNAKLEAINNPIILEDKKCYDKKKVLLLATRMDRIEKSPQNLIPIWKIVSEACPDWELKILGDGPDREYIENEFRKAKLKNYHFYGFRDSVPFFKEASIFTLVSNTEGFSMVLLEAMKYGAIPFAYLTFSGLYDLLLPSTRIPSHQPKIYAQKLIEVMRNPILQEQLRNEYFNHVKNFDINNVAERWLYLFENE